MKNLWGDRFFDLKTKKWSSQQSEGSKRGFNQFVLDPIFKVRNYLDYLLRFRCGSMIWYKGEVHYLAISRPRVGYHCNINLFWVQSQ